MDYQLAGKLLSALSGRFYGLELGVMNRAGPLAAFADNDPSVSARQNVDVLWGRLLPGPPGF